MQRRVRAMCVSRGRVHRHRLVEGCALASQLRLQRHPHAHATTATAAAAASAAATTTTAAATTAAAAGSVEADGA
jgi:hypothetical protein